MKRTISHEASAAAARLRELGIGSALAFSGGAVDPLTVFGLGPHARWPEVRQAYIERLRVFHPEHHPQEFMRVVDAYDTLKRFFRASVAASTAESGDGDEDNFSGCFKRRRANEAGSAFSSTGAVAPSFAGLQECWQVVAAPSPVIALDNTGVGHIGRHQRIGQGSPMATDGSVSHFPQNTASPSPFGTCFNSSSQIVADDGNDEGPLLRSVSNHMAPFGNGYGGMRGAPLSGCGGMQPIHTSCGISQQPLFGDAMAIG